VAHPRLRPVDQNPDIATRIEKSKTQEIAAPLVNKKISTKKQKEEGGKKRGGGVTGIGEAYLNAERISIPRTVGGKGN